MLEMNIYHRTRKRIKNNNELKNMKLNLGSNDVRHEGYLNVDIRKARGVDIVDDVTKLDNIKDGSVESIIAHNILEHIAPDRTMEVLSLWFEKIKKGGDIEIGVPDGELIFERHRSGIITREEYKNSPWKNVIHSIFGNMNFLREWHGEEAEKYMHHTLFCESYLKECMENTGFVNIKKVASNHKDNVTLRGEKS